MSNGPAGSATAAEPAIGRLGTLVERARPLGPRLGLVILGSLSFGVAQVMNIQANVGQAPWVAFHYGMTLHLPLSVGQANIVMSIVMIVVSAALGVLPGIATLISVTIVGWMIDALLNAHLIPPMVGWLDGYAMLLAGVFANAFGTTLMVKASLGTGPRDSFMLALSLQTGKRVGLVRSGIDVTALTLGFLMGSPVGLGTLVYALSNGPAVECWFRIFGLRAHRRREAAVTG